MKDEYLWDRSGEPDPEIQQLEEILGTLRHQPKLLEIPAGVVIERSSRFTPLAIAATLVLTLLAAGLWYRLETRNKAPEQQARAPQSVDVPRSTPTQITWDSWKSAPVVAAVATHPGRPITRTTRREQSEAAALSAAELKEAQEAKAQLLMALRVASEKLSLAQKKVQNPGSPNQIRNQHRIG